MRSLPLSPGSWCKQSFMSSKSGVSVSPSPVELLYSILLSFKVRFPGIPILCWIPMLEACHGAQKLHKSRRTSSVLESSPVCGLPTQWVWNWILSQLHASYYLTVASSLSVDVGYLFLVGFNSLLLMAVQEFKTVVILVLLQKEISTHHPILPS